MVVTLQRHGCYHCLHVHLATRAYHYHEAPSCLLDAIGATAGDVVVGFALDGFALHAPVDGLELDECHGREVDGDYRYYITTEAPYLPPCLKGDRIGTVETEAVAPPVACPKRTLSFESDSSQLDDARDCSGSDDDDDGAWYTFRRGASRRAARRRAPGCRGR